MRSATRQTLTECMGTAGQQACDWEIRHCELEGRVAFDAAREVESVSTAHKGLCKECGYAGESACTGLSAPSSNSMPLTIENTLWLNSFLAWTNNITDMRGVEWDTNFQRKGAEAQRRFCYRIAVSLGANRAELTKAPMFDIIIIATGAAAVWVEGRIDVSKLRRCYRAMRAESHAASIRMDGG